MWRAHFPAPCNVPRDSRHIVKLSLWLSRYRLSIYKVPHAISSQRLPRERISYASLCKSARWMSGLQINSFLTRVTALLQVAFNFDQPTSQAATPCSRERLPAGYCPSTSYYPPSLQPSIS
uniref:Uncharacterized protein n=1 Tax=Podarcis muralis TaxID=64176 RepID=A0A670IYF4_PODMU